MVNCSSPHSSLLQNHSVPGVHLPLTYSPMAPRTKCRHLSPGFPLPIFRECHSMALLSGFYATDEAQECWRYQGHWGHHPCCLYPCHFTLDITLLFIHVFAMKRIWLFLESLLILKATLFFQFLKHYLKPFREDSLGPGAECICKVLHHHAQERAQETWFFSSQGKFLAGHGTCWWMDLTSPFCSRAFISVTFMFLEMTVIIISVNFPHHIVQKLLEPECKQDTWGLDLTSQSGQGGPPEYISHLSFLI